MSKLLAILLLTLTGCQFIPCATDFYRAGDSREPCIKQARAWSQALLKAGHKPSIVVVDVGHVDLHVVVLNDGIFYDTTTGKIRTADQIGEIKLIIPQEKIQCQRQ